MLAAERQGFTVVTEVATAALPEITALLAEIQRDPGANPHVPFGRAGTTHFACLVIIDRAEDRALGYPPLLVLDVSHDGERRAYLDALVSRAGDGLHALFRHAVGYPGRAELLRFLHQRIVRASASHLGYPGRSVRGVQQGRTLRQLVCGYLDSPRGRGLRGAGPATPDVRVAIRRTVQAARREQPTLTTGQPVERRFARARGMILAFPTGLLAAIALILLAFTLRLREWADGHEKYTPPLRRLPELREVREDVQVQNHLTHLVTIRSGVRRALALRVALYLVDQLSRVYFTKGDLAGIPTIHFARWVILRGGQGRKSRLLFLSNYDLSWDSYLGDFIDRSHHGLTGVWGHTRGFPAAKWIIKDGARDEDAFKAWTRRHQLPEQVWYAACPGQTVANVLADAALRDGLERDLDDARGRKWLARL